MQVTDSALKTSQIFDPVTCAVGRAIRLITVLPQTESHDCLVTKYNESVLDLLYFEAGATKRITLPLFDVVSNKYDLHPLYTYDEASQS